MITLPDPVVRKAQFRVLMLISSMIAAPAIGQDAAQRNGSSKTSLDSISFEVMKGGTTQNRHAVVTWFPSQYVEALGKSSGIPTKEIQDTVNALRPYNMFFVLSRTLGPPHLQKIETAEEIRNQIRFVDRFGKVHPPLRDELISADAKSVAKELASGFEKGKPGLKMTVVMFRSTNESGQPLADATKEGSFKITMGGLSIGWELPLNSVVNRRP